MGCSSYGFFLFSAGFFSGLVSGCTALLSFLAVIGRRRCLALYGLYVLIYCTLVLGQDMQNKPNGSLCALSVA